jgi:uncharacterized protein
MKFAVNYSIPLIHLLEEKAIKVDLIKCPDWEGMLEEAKSHNPITIHYDHDVGLGNTFNLDLSRVENLMKQTATPHVNTHLVTPLNFNPDDKHELEKINQLWREEIKVLTDHFGAELIALEHFPYTSANPHIRTAADSEVFSKVIQDTGCMLLLDLAHARITADTLGIDVKDYIQDLPLDRLAELHITGIRLYAGVLTDHFELKKEGWENLKWALSEIQSGNWRKPCLVGFEYGGVGDVFVWRTEQQVLQSQVPKLYEMIHDCD